MEWSYFIESGAARSPPKHALCSVRAHGMVHVEWRGLVKDD
jgi:hypothetical protein